jgi:ABC-type thiamin/hydroxymethylpyrimidine transport system permease subunit
MKFSTRELVTIAVFGTLWGMVEISMGAVLHAINVPMTGVVLGAIGLMIALVGRIFVPKRGSTLFIGVIAMLLKLFSLGSVVIGPMVGILMEALVAEIVLSLAKQPSRISFMVAGALGVTWTLLQPFITNPLLFGRSVLIAWLDLLDTGSRLLGLGSHAALWIVLAMLVICLVIGCVAGWLAWGVGGLLQLRMGKTSARATIS